MEVNRRAALTRHSQHAPHRCTPTCRAAHQRVRRTAFTHMLEHEHARPPRSTAFSLCVSMLHNQHLHSTTPTFPSAPADVAHLEHAHSAPSTWPSPHVARKRHPVTPRSPHHPKQVHLPPTTQHLSAAPTALLSHHIARAPRHHPHCPTRLAARSQPNTRTTPRTPRASGTRAQPCTAANTPQR